MILTCALAIYKINQNKKDCYFDLFLSYTVSLKLIICYMPPILLRSAVGSNNLIGKLHWALFIVIQSIFCFGSFVYLFIAELESNNKRADEDVSLI